LEKEREKNKNDNRSSRRPPKAPSGEPDAKKRYTFTDSDNRIMKDDTTKSFEQIYNCQAAVDG
jgi:hypothetical protein